MDSDLTKRVERLEWAVAALTRQLQEVRKRAEPANEPDKRVDDAVLTSVGFVEDWSGISG